MIVITMIRVLVVDDSAFMRLAITNILKEQRDIEVVGTAKNGKEAVEKAVKLEPDIITMDINMPVMDGLEALKLIMQKKPTAVIMLSALTKEGAKETFEALKLGAVDFIAKPHGSITSDLKLIEEEILSKIRNVYHSNPNITRLFNLRKFRSGVVRGRWNSNGSEFALVIGSSTGGPSALEQIIPRLPSDLPASVFVVQHIPRGDFSKQLAERLNNISELEVKEAENNERVRTGVVYIAPGGYHMKIRESLGVKRIKVLSGKPVNAVIPSVDVTAESIANVYGGNTIGIILTGMGSDGAYGLKLVRNAGGYCIASSEDTCVVFGMPKAAIEIGAVDTIRPLFEIPEEIVRVLEVKSGGN